MNPPVPNRPGLYIYPFFRDIAIRAESGRYKEYAELTAARGAMIPAYPGTELAGVSLNTFSLEAAAERGMPQRVISRFYREIWADGISEQKTQLIFDENHEFLAVFRFNCNFY